MLNYVLVPVPREHVLEIMRWVLYRAEVDLSARQRDHARFTTYLNEASPDTLRLLTLLAHTTLDGTPPSLVDLSDLLELDRPTVRALINSVQRDGLEDGREAIELSRQVTVAPGGRLGSRVFVSLRQDLVPMVRARALVEGG